MTPENGLNRLRQEAAGKPNGDLIIVRLPTSITLERVEPGKPEPRFSVTASTREIGDRKLLLIGERIVLACPENSGYIVTQVACPSRTSDRVTVQALPQESPRGATVITYAPERWPAYDIESLELSLKTPSDKVIIDFRTHQVKFVIAGSTTACALDTGHFTPINRRDPTPAMVLQADPTGKNYTLRLVSEDLSLEAEFMPGLTLPQPLELPLDMLQTPNPQEQNPLTKKVENWISFYFRIYSGRIKMSR